MKFYHIFAGFFKLNTRNLNYSFTQHVSKRFKMDKIVVAEATKKHKIAICQLTCTEDKSKNFQICKNLITDASKQGAKIVFLPEACDFIESSGKATLEKAERIDGDLITNYKQLARDLNVWIAIGSFHRAPDNLESGKIANKSYNTSVLLDNNGEIKMAYDKMHLFEINLKNQPNIKESDYTFHGEEFYMPIDTPIGSLGPAICFDLRFPQLSTILRKLGAQVLSYPSVFVVSTGEAHWEVLLRARAIENQCYVIAAAQVGKHNEKRSSYGHSMVIDPWGRILANCGLESPTFKIVDIDIDYLDEVRSSIPIINSFRTDLYLQMPLIKKKIDKEFYQFGESIKIPNSSVFLETAHCIAFVNIKPIVPGHVVIIPKELRLRVEDMTAEESVELFHVSSEIASKLERYYKATSVNFGIQDGPDAGQSVKHVHLHVIPRRTGDFRKDEIYDKLRQHDKDDRVNGRSESVMAEEANELRKLFYNNVK